MTKKAFDILAPAKKENKQVTKPKQTTHKAKNKKSGWLFIVLLFIISGVFVTQLANWKPQKDAEYLNKVNLVENKNNNKTGFELFGENGNSSFTKETIIRLLNASGNINKSDEAKTILLGAGYKIEQITNTESTYDKSYIYYRKGEITKAQVLEKILKDKYAIELQESDTLAPSYNLLLIVGEK